MKINITKDQFDNIINNIVAATKHADDLVSHGIHLEELENTIEQFENFIGEIFEIPDIIGDFIYWLVTGNEMFIPHYILNDEDMEIKTIDELWDFVDWEKPASFEEVKTISEPLIDKIKDNIECELSIANMCNAETKHGIEMALDCVSEAVNEFYGETISLEEEE